MFKNKLNEEKLNNIIEQLLEDKSIKAEEINILLEFKSNKNENFMKRIQDFKNNISKLQLDHGFDYLSIEISNLYSEILRQYPTTGPSSIFNRFIKK